MADRYYDPGRWRYTDEERYREEFRRPRYDERDEYRWRPPSEREWRRSGDREWNPGGRDWRDDERGFFERFADEMRSWFGDEEAHRRRLRDEREDRGGDRDRWGNRDHGELSAWRRSWSADDDTARQWGYIDRSEAAGRSWGRGGERFGQPMWPGYRGVGPRGWQRSDDRIREDLCERMSQHPHLDASDIEIRVASGEVTLTGNVEDRHAKRLAEDLAEAVSGVRDVHNEIRVKSRLEGQDLQGQVQPQRGISGERRIA